MSKKWLLNKTVVISGASGGIGFNVAKLLIEKYNCKIIGICRNKEKMEKAISTLSVNKDNFTYYTFDVSKRQNWQDFVNHLNSKNIIPDVLINNAGFMLPFVKFEKISDEEIDEIIATDFASVIYSTKALIPLLKQSKTPAIINVSSAAGLSAVVGESMYCATKFGVRGFTETLIQDYKKQIYVCGVYPGFIKTDILHRMSVSDKENKLISKLMMPINKASKKIVKGIAKKKKRIVMGFDGRMMWFFGKLFPTFTHNLTTKVLKMSKLDLFEDAFN